MPERIRENHFTNNTYTTYNNNNINNNNRGTERSFDNNIAGADDTINSLYIHNGVTYGAAYHCRHHRQAIL